MSVANDKSLEDLCAERGMCMTEQRPVVAREPGHRIVDHRLEFHAAPINEKDIGGDWPG